MRLGSGLGTTTQFVELPEKDLTGVRRDFEPDHVVGDIYAVYPILQRLLREQA